MFYNKLIRQIFFLSFFFFSLHEVMRRIQCLPYLGSASYKSNHFNGFVLRHWLICHFHLLSYADFQEEVKQNKLKRLNLKTAETCWARAGCSLRRESGFGLESGERSPLLLRAAAVTVGRVRGLFLFLPCLTPRRLPPLPLRDTYLFPLSLCLPQSPPFSTL